MVKKSDGLIWESQKLRQENAALQQQLREARASVDAIKKGGIDAVVFAGEKDLKIYTQSTADKIYRVLVEKMNEGAVTLDGEGNILFSNSYFALMVNMPLQKITGTKFKKFTTKTFHKRLEALLNAGNEVTLKEEIYLLGSRGRKMRVQMTATTFSVDAIFVVSIILTDLTVQKKDQDELKLRTKQLRQNNTELHFEIEEKEKRALELLIVNKELESFTYVSSHDLQEPVRKIQVFAARILEKEYAVLSDAGKDYLHRMNNAARRMQMLIEDLLSYSQAKNEEQKLETTNLTIVIEDVLAELAETIREKVVVVDLGDMCDITIIRFQFRQVVHNLISNALKFSKPAVPLLLKISSEKGEGRSFEADGLSPGKSYCHVSFIDNGIGFNSQYKDKIFEVFQRLHGKEEYAGTGIGLAIVKKIVQNHNGVITASGESGKGARFDIYLPA